MASSNGTFQKLVAQCAAEAKPFPTTKAEAREQLKDGELVLSIAQYGDVFGAYVVCRWVCCLHLLHLCARAARTLSAKSERPCGCAQKKAELTMAELKEIDVGNELKLMDYVYKFCADFDQGDVKAAAAVGAGATALGGAAAPAATH